MSVATRPRYGLGSTSVPKKHHSLPGGRTVPSKRVCFKPLDRQARSSLSSPQKKQRHIISVSCDWKSLGQKCTTRKETASTERQRRKHPRREVTAETRWGHSPHNSMEMERAGRSAMHNEQMICLRRDRQETFFAVATTET